MAQYGSVALSSGRQATRTLPSVHNLICMWMYEYVHIYYMYMYIYVYIYIYIHNAQYVCVALSSGRHDTRSPQSLRSMTKMCRCIYVYILYMHMYRWHHAYIYMALGRICGHLHMCIYICICVYIYMYIYIFKYVYIYICFVVSATSQCCKFSGGQYTPPFERKL